jgi:hypothetical protein
MRKSVSGAVLIVIAVLAAACGSTSGPAASQGSIGASSPTAAPTFTPSFPLKPVPGNSVVAPLPSDVPAQIRALKALPSCGAEVLFEEDVDITPIPTPPGPTTNPTDNQLALNCLMAAWENGAAAQMTVSQTSDEADQIYSLYRLPGDGTLQLVVRVLSHADHTISWTRTVCRQLSVQDGDVTPADCDSETPIS